jgi:hypothetical protein
MDRHGLYCMVVGFTFPMPIVHINTIELDTRPYGGLLDTTLCDKACQ